MMNKSGVTLLELVIVVTIIGIAAAIAVPNMGPWLAKQRLNTAARTMATHFNQARSRAIQGNENVRFSFDTDDNWYSAVADSTGTVVPQTPLPQDITITAVGLVDSLGNATTTTGFSSRGVSLSNGTVTIRSSRLPSDHSRNIRNINISVGGGVTITP